MTVGRDQLAAVAARRRTARLVRFAAERKRPANLRRC